ncbi:MAG: hybrid sensor histidine kinase/response regulator [Acidobacteria bacterium]|nr:MAG: hybrid sensor histidine kinase/response regulator [Acidobacteriota bacterium]
MERTLRILHLEDDPNDMELVRSTLKKGGIDCDVEVVSDRPSFVAAFERGNADLILSDFSLPSFDGLSALKIVRDRAADLPFIIVSGTLGEEAAIESLHSGATDYVLKHRLARLGPAVCRAMSEADGRRARREVEEALQNERQFLRALLESLEVGIVACDRNGILTLFNRATREFHGLPEEPLPPERWAEHLRLFRADGKTPLEKEAIPLFRALQGEQVRNAELTIVPADGLSRTVVASGQPILDGHGRNLGAVIAMHDITERKQLEEQLRQSQKMEAVGRLAGGIAHDFNNLLNVITGYGELISERLPQGDPMGAKVDQIKKAAQRAASLTRQLLAFSRKQVIEPRVLDLNALLADLDKMLRRMIGEDIEMSTVEGQPLGRIKADPGQIEQIVMNLVVNARDAMPQGGKLTLGTANVDLDQAFARRNAGARAGAYVLLSVGDTGTGMDPETQSHIFEPFFTTKEMGKGTGLGLATVYGIVKQNNGYIEVESAPGRGACFRVYLPRVQDRAEALRARESTAPPQGSETILVVEDEDLVRQVVREALRSFGYTVLETGDAEEGARICKSHAGPIHLLMTDVIMPKMNGRALAKRLTLQRPDLKVLYMSGYTDSAIVQHGVLEPGVSFLQKPFALTALARKVRDVLDEEGVDVARKRSKRSVG